MALKFATYFKNINWIGKNTWRIGFEESSIFPNSRHFALQKARSLGLNSPSSPYRGEHNTHVHNNNNNNISISIHGITY